MPTRLLPGSVGSFYVRVADVFIVLLYMWWLIACVASVSVWFRSKERPEKDRGRGLSVLTAREMKREPQAPLFSRSLTLVPRSFRLNRTETLATQARWLRTLKQKQYKLSISTSMLFIIRACGGCVHCVAVHVMTNSLRSKRFRLVSEQRKTRERPRKQRDNNRFSESWKSVVIPLLSPGGYSLV